jgi:hypothetical protein
MLQVLHINVASVNRDVAHVAYVASVSDEYCKFVLDVRCKRFFYLDVALFHTYVARVCSKYFICSNLILQQVFSCYKLQIFYPVIVAIYVCCKCMFQIF